jgi:hypothetical protein
MAQTPEFLARYEHVSAEKQAVSRAGQKLPATILAQAANPAKLAFDDALEAATP